MTDNNTTHYTPTTHTKHAERPTGPAYRDAWRASAVAQDYDGVDPRIVEAAQVGEQYGLPVDPERAQRDNDRYQREQADKTAREPGADTWEGTFDALDVGADLMYLMTGSGPDTPYGAQEPSDTDANDVGMGAFDGRTHRGGR